MSTLDRRQLLSILPAFALARISTASSRIEVPNRVVTRGPRHHWFGYYDKFQFDSTGRYLLGMAVDFEHRTPAPNDQIQIGMVDLKDNDRWIDLGQTTAWNWQQGCMLQWLPGHSTKVIWNDRVGGKFVSHILNIKSKKKRTIPCPVYSVSPDGTLGVTPDFARIHDVRPGYGYAGIKDAFADDLAPSKSGIRVVDLRTGDARQIISHEQIARIGPIPKAELGIKHYFNHLLFSPDGTRFIFLHRWRYSNGSRLTRLITARTDGTDIRVVVPNGYASHFIWRDPKHILVQSKNLKGNKSWSNFLFEDREGGSIEEVGRGVLDGTGHISYLPGARWILNDTYPKTSARIQTPHLYEVSSGKRVDLGRFHLPKVYAGEWRVDTHPRISRDGKWVCIDAPVDGQGRQLHLLDIRAIVGA